MDVHDNKLPRQSAHQSKEAFRRRAGSALGYEQSDELAGSSDQGLITLKIEQELPLWAEASTSKADDRSGLYGAHRGQTQVPDDHAPSDIQSNRFPWAGRSGWCFRASSTANVPNGMLVAHRRAEHLSAMGAACTTGGGQRLAQRQRSASERLASR
jgi:hypothetical protein